MSGERRAWLDAIPGERRGVITLNGRPERLLIERDEDPPNAKLGARVAARVRALERTSRLAFFDLGEGVAGTAPLEGGLTIGAAVVVEVAAEPRRDKTAVVRVLGPADGPAPRLIDAAPTLEARLAAWAPGPPVVGERARDAADVAESEALAEVHALPGGGDVAIQRTRALTAVDVDLGGPGGDAIRAVRAVNLRALAETARLLRLKGLGGLVVIDLIGAGQASEPLLVAAREAFAPDQPGVVFGPLSRFGLLQLALPWRAKPAVATLLDEKGRSVRTLASDAVRSLERAGRDDPGGRFEAWLDPEVAELARPHIAALGARFGARAERGRARDQPDIRRL